MKILQLQLHVHEDKKKNIEQLARYMEQVREENAGLIMVGEMFNCPYQTEYFPRYAEKEGGECWQMLSALARKHQVYLAAGSMPESDDAGNVYNTAYVFDRQGRQIAKHRKVHLFDVDIEGGQYFRESDTLTAGNGCTVFDTEFGRMGLCICFDLRFPELSLEMARRGAKLILVPAAFNMTTGPAHWELLFRARAADSQCFFAGTSAARDAGSGYTAWGHSILTSPWGEVIAQMEEKEGYQVSEIHLEDADKVRRELPLIQTASGNPVRQNGSVSVH